MAQQPQLLYFRTWECVPGSDFSLWAVFYPDRWEWGVGCVFKGFKVLTWAQILNTNNTSSGAASQTLRISFFLFSLIKALWRKSEAAAGNHTHCCIVLWPPGIFPLKSSSFFFLLLFSVTSAFTVLAPSHCCRIKPIHILFQPTNKRNFFSSFFFILHIQMTEPLRKYLHVLRQRFLPSSFLAASLKPITALVDMQICITAAIIGSIYSVKPSLNPTPVTLAYLSSSARFCSWWICELVNNVRQEILHTE